MSEDNQKMDSAHSYLAKVTLQNKQQKEAAASAKAKADSQQKLLDKQNENKGSLSSHGRFLPNVNPADRAHVGVPPQSAPDDRLVPYQDGSILTRILDLENNACGILYSLNNASISATCNTDNTITITLTLPSLPAVC